MENQDKVTICVVVSGPAKKQFEELMEFADVDNPTDLLKLGISFIQKYKEIFDGLEKIDKE